MNEDGQCTYEFLKALRETIVVESGDTQIIEDEMVLIMGVGFII